MQKYILLALIATDLVAVVPQSADARTEGVVWRGLNAAPTGYTEPLRRQRFPVYAAGVFVPHSDRTTSSSRLRTTELSQGFQPLVRHQETKAPWKGARTNGVLLDRSK